MKSGIKLIVRPQKVPLSFGSKLARGPCGIATKISPAAQNIFQDLQMRGIMTLAIMHLCISMEVLYYIFNMWR